MEKYDSANEFDVEAFLGLAVNNVSGTKIVGGFTDCVNFVVGNAVLK